MFLYKFLPYTSGSTDLGTHVANGSHSGTGDGVNARAVVLNDRSGTALHGEDTRDFQDYILGAGPALQLTWMKIILKLKKIKIQSNVFR